MNSALAKKLLAPEPIVLLVLLLIPFLPYSTNFSGKLTEIFIFAILALGLNVAIGSAGILHLGIAAFFGIGAYITGVLTIPSYPFQVGFVASLIFATFGAGLVGALLAIPTLRLRGDYLALVTLGFGEVVKFSIRNFEEITAGTRSLNPIPPPAFFGINFTASPVPFYFLCLGMLIVLVILLRNLDNSRLGRAWNALREDELAAACMGVNVPRVKLAALTVAAAVAGFAGCLYATRLASTAQPEDFGFNRSITTLCCVILGGMGNIRGVLLGCFILLGFDNIATPLVDAQIQSFGLGGSNSLFTFSSWRLLIFGAALVLVVRWRPEGLLPSKRVQQELHSEYRDKRSILSEESMFQ